MFDWSTLLDILLRLAAAVVLGGVVGLERQLHGRWADLRTYMSVSMGAAMFMAIGEKAVPAGSPEVTRVIQGIAAGVGFLGAGTILKLSDQMEIKGLTTASSIWLAAALGTAAGMALYPLAVAGTIVSLMVLVLLRPFEKQMDLQGRDEESGE